MTKEKSEEKRRSFVLLNTLVRCHGTIVLLLLLPAKAAAADSPPMAPPGNPYTLNNGAFNPSMAIIVVVLIGAFFFMGFLSIYIRQCAGEAADTIQQPNNNNGRRRSSGRGGPRGLDQTIIETFPTFMYSVVKGLKLGKGNLECAVCLSEFQDDENLRLLPKCDHVFHPECIDAWLASHTTCPVCRADLHPPDPAAEPLADPEEEEEEENGVITADDVSITIEDEHNPPILHREDSSRILQESIKNRPARTGGSSFRWSRFKGSKYPRSHSTGHSLVQTENYDRYTLRLPENIRKQIVRGKLNRTISCVAFPTEGGSVSGSSHGGYKAGEGSSRGKSLRYGRIETVVKSDRWVFPKALLRSFSKAKGGGEVALAASADGEDSTSSRGKPIVGQPFLPSYLRTSFDSCLGGKPELPVQSTPVPVLSSQSSASAPVPAPS